MRNSITTMSREQKLCGAISPYQLSIEYYMDFPVKSLNGMIYTCVK